MSKSDAQSEKLIVGDVAVKPDGEKLQKGTTVTWTATDGSGNTATATQVLRWTLRMR